MCETMQSSHRLRPAMSLVRALLAPTASGDGTGARFCAPLPLSPPRFLSPHFRVPQKSLNLSRLPVKGPICQGSLLGGHNDVSDGGDKRSIKSLFQTPLSHAGSGVCLFLKF